MKKVESTRASTAHFSWADEVEKEENLEEARAHLILRRPKPNPFGSARPRELVLEERGIDWRKHDQEFHHTSTPREDEAEKEEARSQLILRRPKRKPFGSARPREVVLKEEVIGQGKLFSKRKLDQELYQSSSHSFVCRKEKMMKENIPTMAELVDRKEHVPLSHHGQEQIKQNTSSQTRNARHLHHQIACRSACLDHQKQNLDPLVPPLLYAPRNIREEMQDSYPLYQMDAAGWHNSRYKRPIRELDLERERENMNYHIEDFVQEASSARIWANYKIDARVNKEIQFSRRKGVGERFVGLPEESYFGGNYEKRGARLEIQRSDWENIQYEYGRRNYDVREFVSDPRREIGDGGRARGYCDLNMERPGFEGNYRKRGMSSAPEISHHHQRRR